MNCNANAMLISAFQINRAIGYSLLMLHENESQILLSSESTELYYYRVESFLFVVVVVVVLSCIFFSRPKIMFQIKVIS